MDCSAIITNFVELFENTPMKKIFNILLISLIHITFCAQAQNVSVIHPARTVAFEDSLPEVSIAGLSDNCLKYASDVLQECCKTPIPEKGLPQMFFAPGGYYGGNCWQLDFSVALLGYKWINQAMAEQMFLNYETLQKSDGRIPLFTGTDATLGSKQKHGVSSLPKAFDAGYQLSKRSTNMDFVSRTAKLLDRYFNWFLSNRYNEKLGLFSGVFEETFPPYLGVSGEYFPTDLNAELVHACYGMSSLWKRLGDSMKQSYYKRFAQKLSKAMRKHLWNKEKQAFFSLYLKDNRFDDRLCAESFMALRYQIANHVQRKALTKLLTDSARFNWDSYPLTSVDKKSYIFKIIRGHYYGKCWEGDVWALLNEGVVRGLKESDCNSLSAELNYKTLQIFDNICTEFLTPDDGKGYGVERYGWTAGLYIELLLEQLLGIDYDAAVGTLTISPLLPAYLENKTISINNLRLPNNKLFSMKRYLHNGKPCIECRYNNQIFTGSKSVKINL
jgi:hypothetical protein